MLPRRDHLMALFVLVLSPPALLAGPAGRPEGAPPAAHAARPAGIIRGKIVAEGTGAPVASAQVQLGTRGAQTNDVGVFTFGNVPAGTYTLQVRMIGFERYSRSVTVSDDQTAELTITLKRQALSLDQIVVTGTPGAARRREVGNAVSQIDVTSLPEVPATVDGLLQGKATGLTVTGNSGGVGGGASIRLRGNVSATQSNQPLIYVDGVRVKSDGFPKNTFPTGYAGNSDNTVYSPLNDIDPGRHRPHRGDQGPRRDDAVRHRGGVGRDPDLHEARHHRRLALGVPDGPRA